MTCATLPSPVTAAGWPRRPSIVRRRGVLVRVTVGVAAVVLVAASMLAVRKGTAWLAHGAGVPAPGPASGTAVIDPGLPRLGSAPVRVVIEAAPGQVAAARAAAERVGARVGVDLPIIDGFGATIAAGRIGALARSGVIVAITADRQAQFSSFSFDSTTSASNFVTTSGAGQAWTQGLYGDGIGVAVIDTGVSPHNDLAGRITWGPDLSGEGKLVDSYGHGTVMGGIIAGNGSDSAGSGAAYTGVAPHANLVAVKTAGYNGTVDVSTILQAMHWVSAYQSQYNIRVLNLSWGVASTQSPSVDPLDYAVERLWNQGIVVVVAAGNDGPQAGTVTKPGDDPAVITVGAYDDKQNSDPSDDSVASWSSEGPTAQGLVKPDIVAPGRYIIATRSLGSDIEASYPKALYPPSYIRGSGTSEATAVTSGLAALLLEAHPSWTPDQVKYALTSTGSPISGFSSSAQGSGRVQLGAALKANVAGAPVQSPSGSGQGSLESARGGVHVQTTCPQNNQVTAIQGEMDVRCEQWVPSAWAGTAWTGTAWTGTAWTGTAWTTATWNGTAWTGGVWTGGSWQGTAWTGTAWTSTSWTGTAWTGTAWTGTAWTGASWAGTAWTGTAWTGTAWTSGSYDDFLTAFWGAHPSRWDHLPGEVPDGNASTVD